jgi:hypothetical protein
MLEGMMVVVDFTTFHNLNMVVVFPQDYGALPTTLKGNS